MHYPQFEKLFKSMGHSNQDRDRFLFTYNGVDFDVIVALDTKPFQLLVGAINKNWACILKCEKGYRISMEDEDYYALCKILDLKHFSGRFNSNTFIQYMADHCPEQCSGKVVDPVFMIRHVHKMGVTYDEEEKTVFKGWNDHIKDKKTARNFEKTGRYFGVKIADYCRENNISSVWTTPQEAFKRVKGSYPPGFTCKDI